MQFSNFFMANPSIEIYRLDIELYRELSFFFDTNHSIQHCFNLLDRFLLFEIDVKGSTKALLKHVHDYFIPFFREVLRNIIILGWCPCTNKNVQLQGDTKKNLLPHVVPVEFITSEIHTNKETFDIDFHFFNLDQTKELHDIYVLSFRDARHFSNGNVVFSILSSLLNDLRFCEQIKRFSIQAEYVRSNPSIYLRTLKGGKGDVVSAHMTGNLGGGVGQAPIQDFAQVQNNQDFNNISKSDILNNLRDASTDIAANLRFHAEQMSSTSHGENLNYYRLGLNGKPQFLNNLFVYPPGTELAANPQMPESRLDLLTIQRNLSSNVFLAFGIPESVFGFIGAQVNNVTRGSTSRGNKIRKDINIMDLNTFDASLKRYQSFLKDSFTHVYFSIFKTKLDKAKITFGHPPLYDHYIQKVLRESTVDEQEVPNRPTMRMKKR